LSVDIQVLAAIVGAVGVIIGGYYALAAMIVKQFKAHLDERFEAQERARIEGRKLWDDRLARVEDEHHELERHFLKHLADLPREYIRREDHVRFETVIAAKLDALYAEMRLLSDRQQQLRA
jgi:hypothetical protein